MIIKPNSYWILKNSNDITDAVMISEIWSRYVIYNYITVSDSHKISIYSTDRKLPKEVFIKCYKPHKVLNLLYIKE